MTKRVSPEYLFTFLDANHKKLTDAEVDIITHVSQCVITHRSLREAAKLIDRAIAENAGLSERRHAIIIGDSGCGKTTLLDMMREKLPEEEKTFKLGTMIQRPFLQVELPSTITPRSMAIVLLRSLGDESALNGTALELTERLVHVLHACNVHVIFIDEFQHLLALGQQRTIGPNKRLLEARNWIKSIINKTQITFVLMGMPDTLTLVDTEQQLERRFTHLHCLEPFAEPGKGDAEMVSFVDGILKSALCLKTYFDGAEFFADTLDDARRLYVGSMGVPSVIKDLVVRATVIAHRSRSRRILKRHFADAFKQNGEVRLAIEAARRRREKRLSLLQAMDGRVLNPFAAPDAEIRTLLTHMAA